MLSSEALSAFSSSAARQFAEARAAGVRASEPFQPRMTSRDTRAAGRRALAFQRAEAGEILPRGSLLDLLI